MALKGEYISQMKISLKAEQKSELYNSVLTAMKHFKQMIKGLIAELAA